MPLINLFKVSWRQEKERTKIQALFCPPEAILCECIKNLSGFFVPACLLAGRQPAAPTRLCYFNPAETYR